MICFDSLPRGVSIGITKITPADIAYAKEFDSVIKLLGVARNTPGTEYSLLPLLQDRTKTFLFPHIEGETMYPVIYEETSGFVKGAFEINEPQGKKILDYNLIDMVFVPALAADLRGYRLGYGKGFYDRFLQHMSSKCLKVIPVSSKLVFESLKIEVHYSPFGMEKYRKNNLLKIFPIRIFRHFTFLAGLSRSSR